MNYLAPVLQIGVVLAGWLDPIRRSAIRKDGAISAAENLLAINEALYEETGGGIFRAWPKKKLEQYKVHYRKQFEAWKHG